MKKLFLVLLFAQICLGQKVDTLQYDVGKQDGFQRIRLLDKKGNIQKVWSTNWKEEGVKKKQYSEYSKKDIRKFQIDSTFDNNNNLIKLERKIGDTIEGEEYEYDSNGQINRKEISIHLKNDYIIFQKWYDEDWVYSAIVDGHPPKRISIEENEFIEAENVFNSRAKKLGLPILNVSNPSSQSNYPSIIIAEYSGSNIQNTKPFKVDTPWEIQWNARGDFFSVYLYSSDGEMVTVLANQSGSGSGSSYYPKKGRYYFSVNAIGDWSITVKRSN